MRIGLFFGSFNPIHVGHLIIANTIAESGEVDEVWFVVSPQNPFKKKKTLLHEFDRYDMVQQAIVENPKLRVTDVEFKMPKPSYTIDTLAYLSDKYPKHKFKVIVGEDNLQHFHKWKNQEQILEYYGLIVYPRPNTVKSPLLDHPNVKVIKAPLVDISATFIRDAIRDGKTIRYLVHEAVLELIKRKKFYLD
ncbi:nicotinate (nicotinamide) nucleotide adenylyltransferase [Limibacter armeniacum]|uniref:nicotinate (nicotinamide) nucleotide adenylyltransferase n=1 Tax=Limibacter armeniacum TaxID=466084 RepID=UPI002FE6A144